MFESVVVVGYSGIGELVLFGHEYQGIFMEARLTAQKKKSNSFSILSCRYSSI
jgi:hypothetical protein